MSDMFLVFPFCLLLGLTSLSWNVSIQKCPVLWLILFQMDYFTRKRLINEQQFKSYFSCDMGVLCPLASSYHYMRVKKSTLTRPVRCSSLAVSLQLCTTPWCQLCEQLLKMILVGLLLNLQWFLLETLPRFLVCLGLCWCMLEGQMHLEIITKKS